MKKEKGKRSKVNTCREPPHWLSFENFQNLTVEDMSSTFKELKSFNANLMTLITKRERLIDDLKQQWRSVIANKDVAITSIAPGAVNQDQDEGEEENNNPSISRKGSTISLAKWRNKCEYAESVFARHKYTRNLMRREIHRTARNIRIMATRVKQLADEIKEAWSAEETRRRDDQDSTAALETGDDLDFTPATEHGGVLSKTAPSVTAKRNYLQRLGLGNRRRRLQTTNSTTQTVLSPPAAVEKRWYDEELLDIGPLGHSDTSIIDDISNQPEPEPPCMDDSSFNVLMWRYKQRAKDLMLNHTLRNPHPAWLNDMKEQLNLRTGRPYSRSEPNAAIIDIPSQDTSSSDLISKHISRSVPTMLTRFNLEDDEDPTLEKQSNDIVTCVQQSPPRQSASSPQADVESDYMGKIRNQRKNAILNKHGKSNHSSDSKLVPNFMNDMILDPMEKKPLRQSPPPPPATRRTKRIPTQLCERVVGNANVHHQLLPNVPFKDPVPPGSGATPAGEGGGIFRHGEFTKRLPRLPCMNNERRRSHDV